MLEGCIVKRNNKLDDLLSNLTANAGQKFVQVGHFAESGLHHSGMNYAELMSFHHHGGPIGGVHVPSRPLLRILSNRIFKKREPELQAQIKSSIKRLVNSDFSNEDYQAFLDSIGRTLVQIEKSLFGKPLDGIPPNAELTKQLKGKDSPLVDTGDLRDKTSYKTSMSEAVK